MCGDRHDVVVRRLTKSDAAEYRRVRLDGLKNYPVAFNGCYDIESLLPLDDFAARIFEPPNLSAIFGAFIFKNLFGVVALDVSAAVKLSHKATLWGMYTMPSARGMGIGNKMMQALLSYAAQIPCMERILLSVTASNTQASRWYEELGFKLYGLEPKAVKFGNKYEDDELRVLELNMPNSH
jgi:ribosomal protein S18 acetylase RimI-like enzyme